MAMFISQYFKLKMLFHQQCGSFSFGSKLDPSTLLYCSVSKKSASSNDRPMGRSVGTARVIHVSAPASSNSHHLQVLFIENKSSVQTNKNSINSKKRESLQIEIVANKI